MVIKLPKKNHDLIVNNVLMSYGLSGEYTMKTGYLNPGKHEFVVAIRETGSAGEPRKLVIPNVESGKTIHIDFVNEKNNQAALVMAPLPTKVSPAGQKSTDGKETNQPK